MSKIKLYDVLKAFYDDGKKTTLKEAGFNYESSFSSKKLQTFFNPTDKILIFSIRGTDPTSFSDLRTDFSLAIGKLRQTKRFKDAANMLKKAKEYFKPSKTIVTGYSLGGAIASGIAISSDKVYTFNRGSTIGSKVKDNEEAYRVEGDLVSANLTGSSSIKKDRTLTDIISPSLSAHELDQLKNDDVNIYY